jgi:4-amino-4-deoxy-L-arabinose transferase-like glycosyltransferase
MMIAKEKSLEKIFPFLLACCFIVNATALFSDIMGPDATLYASIAKYMMQKNDFINLYGNGDDWLDKPHLPFWLAAGSYKVFGVNAFAYKLPNFLAYLLACFFTFKIGIEFFNKEIAQYSTLIFASSLHIALCNFDVRAEVFLTAFCLASTYFVYLNFQSNKLIHLFAAAFFAALAIMCKGIFVLITIGAGFVIYWAKLKKWNEFFKIKWYVFLLLVLLFISPELYCLYTQFDLHPEKIVFGKQGVSGLKFFFWDSQFGRFFNNGPIKGSGDKLFFFHTTLWAFLPWSIALITSIYYTFKKFKNRNYTIEQPLLFILNATAFITFIMFSASKFQLPHYIVIIFPHCSLLVGYYLAGIKDLKKSSINNITLFVISIIVAAFTIIISYYLNSKGWLFAAIAIPVLVYGYYFYHKIETAIGFISKGLIITLILTLFLNSIYFPKILEYQGGMMAGKYQNTNLPNTIATMYQCNDYNFEFYGNSKLKRVNYASEFFLNSNKPQLFIGYHNSYNNINRDSFNVTIIKKFPDFHISEMKAEFLNPKSRNSVLDSFYLATCTKIK